MSQYGEFSRIFVLLASIFLSYGLWAQVHKMYKTKSTGDFATATVISWLVAEISWMNYGLVLREWPLIVLGITNIPAAILATVGYFRYRGGSKAHKEVDK